MFEFVHRSRPFKDRPAHGQGSLVLSDEPLMPSCPPAKRDMTSGQNEGTASPSAPLLLSPVVSHPWALDMPERPGTSSGPGPNGSSSSSAAAAAAAAADTNSFEKRRSKDDLYIHTRAATREFKSYHIPIRGKLPSPRDSAWDGSPTWQSISVRTGTPESLHTRNEIITIGMALGSPTHPPPGAYNNWQLPSMGMTATPVPLESVPEPIAPVSQRQKSTRWKLFGRSKSRSQKPAPRAAPAPVPAGLDRSVPGRRQPKHKPLIVRSQTEPFPYALEEFDQPHETPSREPSKHALRVNGETGQRASQGITSDTTGSRSPLLDVEIPNITMERYSVMFGNLLQTQSSSSALLTRRQATVEKLRSTTNSQVALRDEDVKEDEGQRPPTTATSHAPPFTLFPPPPPSGTSTSPASPPHTLPTGLPAHPRQTVMYAKKPTVVTTAQAVASPAAAANGRLEPGSSPLPRERSESATGDHVRQEPGQIAPQDSPEQRTKQARMTAQLATKETSSTARNKERLRLVVREPAWKVATTLDATTSPRGRSVSSPARTVPEHAKKSSQERFGDEMALNAAVEISIARQISISQQQRHMLRKGLASRPRKQANEPSGMNGLPERLGDRLGPGTPTVKKTKAPVLTNLAENGRLAATKMAMPTVVTPPEPQIGSPLAEHRKSEWIVVENGLT
ncbi:hypothetical protein SODALDRAFT_276420 [Sodiomyces alkalinus F11]|uniref:Uncharacterized protein n=1 Tax=Sodiomyces alkalinus (strain CBS 110278 / VKM F-3762 / F11) TaxID=1314773 RepID=A0A3N2PXZ1_SODAK|nr:hypothetical protein SODALDRAFT_276420 [Sodiomyces alkalinus F11]ROT39399.1 hypothetical protein SODALDRAFT_276420 [Sodiomyces alkalinus F11]